MAVAVDLLPNRYKAGRDDLVIAHMGMVKRVALHLKARLPPFMEVDELVQVGMLGFDRSGARVRCLKRHWV